MILYKCLLHDDVYITYLPFFKYRWFVLGRKIIMGSFAYDDFNIQCARQFVKAYRRSPATYWFKLIGHLLRKALYRVQKRSLYEYYNAWPYNSADSN